jgi:hypothetical protein
VLDLRRQQMQSNLRLRHNVVKLIRRYLEDNHDFVEVFWLYLLSHLLFILSDFLPKYIIFFMPSYSLDELSNYFQRLSLNSGI